jgi:hypothetical protein
MGKSFATAAVLLAAPARWAAAFTIGLDPPKFSLKCRSFA